MYLLRDITDSDLTFFEPCHETQFCRHQKAVDDSIPEGIQLQNERPYGSIPNNPELIVVCWNLQSGLSPDRKQEARQVLCITRANTLYISDSDEETLGTSEHGAISVVSMVVCPRAAVATNCDLFNRDG